jgi:hypothetical protein
MMKTGAVFKLTRDYDWRLQDWRWLAEPVLEAKTGRLTNWSEIQRQCANGIHYYLDQGSPVANGSWFQTDCDLFREWRRTPDTVWFYWKRYGRLAGYDLLTRRFIGSLGPKGFARDIAGAGDRFNNPTGGTYARILATATTVFEVDVEQRTTKPLFTTSEDDPILAAQEISLTASVWEYSAVVTKRFVHLLTAEGKPLWKAPYAQAYPDYARIALYCLEAPGQFALWLAPSEQAKAQAKGKLPTHVIWLAKDQGVVKRAELPELPVPHPEPGLVEKLAGCVVPPALLVATRLAFRHSAPSEVPLGFMLLNGAVAALVCLPIGWWLGRRCRFSLAAQLGWAVFHLLFGVPGLLAFLSVQEWPAREACPNCKKLRVVDRAQCEYCGAPFAPPEKTGTEVFAPLGAKVEPQAAG